MFMFVFRYSSQEVEECQEEYEKTCEITFQPEVKNVSRRICGSDTAPGKLIISRPMLIILFPFLHNK